jgi:hypothetical protein
MSSEDTTSHMAESGVTMRSDSEQYSPGDELSTSPASSNSPVILYKPPTLWSLVRGAAINLLLPFINGMMLGFGELFAHEAAFRLGWGGTKVSTLATSSCPRPGTGTLLLTRSIFLLLMYTLLTQYRFFLCQDVRRTQSDRESKLASDAKSRDRR